MKFFFPLGYDDVPENYISDEMLENILKIDELTHDMTLSNIMENLSDRNGWYKAFNKSGDASMIKAVWLWTLKKLHTYNHRHDVNLDPNTALIHNHLHNIEIALANLYKKGERAPSLDLLNEFILQIKDTVVWINTHAFPRDEAALSFLVLVKTWSLMMKDMPYLIKVAIGSEKINQLKQELDAMQVAIHSRLRETTEEEENRIVRQKAFEAKTTMEQFLDKELSIVHHGTFLDTEDVDSFNEMDNFLIARKNEFELLNILKQMKSLIESNEDKVIGREYFSVLIGADVSTSPTETSYERRDWFDRILEVCDTEDQTYWKERRIEIEHPMITEELETQIVLPAVTFMDSVSAAVRGSRFWAVPYLSQSLKKILENPTMKKLSGYTNTLDNMDKTEFLKLVDKLIHQQCHQSFSEYPALADQLIAASLNKMKELITKTDYIRRLYQADRKLFDFIQTHNVFSLFFSDLLKKYGFSSGPSKQGLLEKAARYQDSIEGLRQSVYRGGVTESQINAIEKAINQLEQTAYSSKSRSSKAKQ